MCSANAFQDGPTFDSCVLVTLEAWNVTREMNSCQSGRICTLCCDGNASHYNNCIDSEACGKATILL